MTLDVVAVEVVEKATEPAHHDLVVIPSRDELAEKVFAVVVAQGGHHSLGNVSSKCLLVADVQLLRVVVRRLLGAHVVDGGVCEEGWMGKSGKVRNVQQRVKRREITTKLHFETLNNLHSIM